jgi:hypothetical protein
MSRRNSLTIFLAPTTLHRQAEGKVGKVSSWHYTYPQKNLYKEKVFCDLYKEKVGKVKQDFLIKKIENRKIG